MKPLIITNRRIYTTDESTLGIISIDSFNVPFCFLLEDEYRKVKVRGESRIPAMVYELGIRKEDTPLTLKHQENKYYKDWFTYHIEVLNVPNYSGIYFHSGVIDEHTMGCQLPGTYPIINKNDFELRQSIAATKRFYELVYPKLDRGETVLYNIID